VLEGTIEDVFMSVHSTMKSTSACDLIVVRL
jgi:hypothetical protein